ncbi:MlaE family ABC transporter permease [Wenzhouxiangella marina]|uniref:ABC transporter permease n=1 Tax=Wenzhouxiangella marina TaxID=1579979 RepID=A0A0K0XZ18_9GAMM|nr:ABC transporter permease [Wenzhouxiangella marina]AKS42866.1 ABC transporter permease [Wenzhouxiangella marina]MBB6087452.1 phospholipid/cholesterol/gamma-HCH transport system permease protein [Wenzhouxiangella marina]
MTAEPALEPSASDPGELLASGDWSVDRAMMLAARVEAIEGAFNALDGEQIERLDSAGALLLSRAARRAGVPPGGLRLQAQHRALYEAVAGMAERPVVHPQRVAWWARLLGGLGRVSAEMVLHFHRLLGFLGLVLATAVRALPRPRDWPLTSIVHHMQQTGLNALPLVALLSFLVGAVVAFLGATVLRDFGAELFVVDLTVFAFLREFGVLLTAILLAGRTASAFTAQIGTMKSREEIDAIRALGLDPILLLVIPRLIALLVTLPILAMLAMVAGLAGGMSVSAASLGIPADLFFDRMSNVVEFRHYLVGLVKAPLFAFVIALVGCLEGFKVAGTAQSVGERTTSAVVQSISLVIVIDALAAVVFMELGW